MLTDMAQVIKTIWNSVFCVGVINCSECPLVVACVVG